MDIRRILTGLFLLIPLAAVAAGPQEQTYGATRYLTGGVGEEERQAMADASSRYNLKLLFTISSGQYLSDVKTTIKDGAGKVVLDTVANGPMALIALKPGSYTVEAVSEGRPLSRKVTVPGKGQQKVVLRWSD